MPEPLEYRTPEPPPRIPWRTGWGYILLATIIVPIVAMVLAHLLIRG